MSKSNIAASGADVYISLHAAFDALGQALFKDTWKDDCWRLGPGPFPDEYEGPSLYDPKIIKPDERDEIEAGGMAVRASTIQCKCYSDTMIGLREGIWFQEFNVVYVPLDETQDDISRTAWRDETGAYTVSIPMSRIYRDRGGRREHWDVQIEKIKFGEFVGRAKKANEKDERISRAIESRSPDGDQHTYNPDRLTELVDIVISDATGTITKIEWARRVEKIYRSEGRKVVDIPGRETILRSIRKFLKYNKIN